jgi:hypothetical protein
MYFNNFRKNPKDIKMAVLSLPADYGYVVLTGESIFSVTRGMVNF